MPHGKDISEKILEDYNDVFADIVNGLVFDGQELIRPEELENALPVSQMKMEDGLHEQERDTAKRWRRGTIVLAAWGLENQSGSDSSMPLRVISYDGATYKEQLNRRSTQTEKPDPFYPSITIVLYFGTSRWSGPRNLRACFGNLPEELDALVPDYPIHVIEIAFLSPEQLGRLKSDFRFVADYLVQTRASGQYIPADGQIVHVDETLKLLGAITGDDRFAQTVNDIALAGRERVTMSSVIDSYIAKGREEASRRYETVIAEKDRSIAEKDRSIAEKDRSIAEKDHAMNRMAQELRELKARYGLA